ncbi:C40 family peptidase [Flavobacterium microcysteis]
MFKKLVFLSLVSVSFVSCLPKKDFVITDDFVKSQAGNNKKNSNAKYSYSTTLSDEDRKYFAKKLEVSETEIINEKLYIFIKSWEGTKYIYGGETRTGIDCSALMQELYSHVYKKDLPRTAAEMSMDNRVELFKSDEKLREGDLVFFRITEEKIISHVGIYLKNNKFFSANLVGGVEISSLKKAYWKKNFVAAGRFKQ